MTWQAREYLFSASFTTLNAEKAQICDCVLQQNLGTEVLFVLSFVLFCVFRVVDRFYHIRAETSRFPHGEVSGIHFYSKQMLSHFKISDEY